MTFFETLIKNPASKLTVCAGIDPTPETLALWDLDDTAKGAAKFSMTMLQAASGCAQVVKFQVAYFERFGAAGYEVLSSMIREARNMDLLVIADAKRGDFRPSIDAYSMAWLGPFAPLQVDAITVSPYLGFAALEPMLLRAHDSGSYVFVVARSSNPEGTLLQEYGEPKLWHRILDEIADWDDMRGNRTVGAVVGATVPVDLKHALKRLPSAFFLVPGVGQQGAKVDDVNRLTETNSRIIISSSRSLAINGPAIIDIQRALQFA